LEKNQVLNEFIFPENSIGILKKFLHFRPFEKSAFKNSKVLFELAHSD
jgi:hypothetical protein